MTISSTTGASSATSLGTTTNTSTAPSTQLTSYSVDRSGLSVQEAVTLGLLPYQYQLDVLNGQLTTNQNKVTVYQYMQKLLGAVKTAAQSLDATSSLSTDVFANRTATLSSSDGVPVSQLMTATVAAGTTVGSHTIQIQQTAASERLGGMTTATSRTTALGLTGSLTIGEAGKTAATINITSGMALNDVVQAINNQSASTGVSAQVITVSSTQYELVLNGNDTNTTFQVQDSTGGTLLGAMGLNKSATGTTSLAGYTAPSSGSFSINGVSVAVTAGDSISTIINNINTSSAGVTASLNASNQLVIASGSQPAVVTADPNGIMSGFGITSSPNQLQAAQPAVLTVDGVNNIQRNTNTINDIIDGVTLNLIQKDTTGTITLGVNPDTTSVQTAITNLVSSYNSWKQYVAANQLTNPDGSASPNAILFGDSTMRGADTAVQNALTALVNGSSLGAIGITMDNNNNLQVNTATLSAALANNFSQVQSLFEYQATPSNGDIHLITHDGATYSGTINLGFTVTGGVASLTPGYGDNANFSISNGIVTGNSGTAYAGLTFGYTGTASENISINASQGIADQVMMAAKKAGDTNTGTIQQMVNGLNMSDSSIQSRISSVTSQMNNYQNYLMMQYGLLESTISTNNQTASIISQMMAYDTAH